MADHEEHSVALEDWLQRLGRALPAERDLRLTAEEEAALLDLARVAAHRSVRIAAPLSTFVVGIALADVAGGDRAASIRLLTSRLSTDTD